MIGANTYIPDPIELVIDTRRLDRHKFMLDPEIYPVSNQEDFDVELEQFKSGQNQFFLVYTKKIPASAIVKVNKNSPTSGRKVGVTPSGDELAEFRSHCQTA